MFLGRYLSSGNATDVPTQIPPSLIPPTLVLSEDAQFFAGGWLTSFDQLAGDKSCSVKLLWDAGGSETGSETRPYLPHQLRSLIRCWRFVCRTTSGPLRSPETDDVASGQGARMSVRRWVVV